MLVHRFVLLSALVVPACAGHEGPPDPPSPAAQIEVKVASVQLVQDCSDPPGDAAVEAASAASMPARAPAAATPAGDVAAGARLRADGPGGWSPPCTQSTMQLSIANVGDRDGALRIEAVRVLDAASRREVSKIGARKPSQWNPGGTYQPWNQVVPAGATVKVGYRLGEPDWEMTEPGVDPFARPYVLEIDVSVDGVTRTVRSPEFVREPVHVIVT